MKKVFAAVLGVMVMVGVAGTASADLAPLAVNLVMYNDTHEIIYDLGAGYDTGSGDIADNFGATLLDDVSIGSYTGFSLFATYNGGWLGWGINEQQADGAAKPTFINSFWSSADYVSKNNDYGVEHLTADQNSFMNMMTPSLKGLIALGDGKGNLTDAEDEMYLWTQIGVTGDPLNYATIKMINNGNGTADFIIEGPTDVSEVPVPAAAWLMGSGLLGLIGVRRKKI